MPNLFRLAGLVPFDDWGGGAAEPAARILDGDLKMGETPVHNEMENRHTKVANTCLRRFTREVWSCAMEAWPWRNT